MKRLAWLLTLPLAVAVVVFAVHNREPVLMDPWPVAPPFAVPLYLLALGAIIGGFIAGAAVQWVSGGKRRRVARQNNRRLTALEREAGGAAAAAKVTQETGEAASRDTGSPGGTKLLAAAER